MIGVKVMRVTEFGGPEVLVVDDAPDPVAGPGQVVVELVAVDVMFFDTLLRSGWGAEYSPVRPPYVPGNGGAGRVLAVGDGVDPGWVGRRVLARTGTRSSDTPSSLTPTGGYAERGTASVRDLVPIPDGLDFPEAAALLHDAPTALDLAAAGAITKGERVLVSAAAGGAGSLLVQLARDAGARVLGAARGERKLEMVRELGAESVVDYSVAGWGRQVWEATGGGGADVVFDGVGGRLGKEAFATVARGGRFVTYGNSEGAFAEIDPQEAERGGITVTGLFDLPAFDYDRTNGQVAHALDLAVQGRIRPVIGATFPLAKAADAHAALADRSTVGKSLLLT